MCTWLISTIYTLTLYLPELVPVRHGHPRPPEGPARPRRGAAASQIRRQSTGTRSGDLRSSEAYALPIQGYHMDLSTGACGGAGGPSAQPLFNSGSTPRISLRSPPILASTFVPPRGRPLLVVVSDPCRFFRCRVALLLSSASSCDGAAACRSLALAAACRNFLSYCDTPGARRGGWEGGSASGGY